MANPPDLNYGTIVGNFKAFVADAADDDDLPDFIPMSGTGKIWPNIENARNNAVGYKSTYFKSDVPVMVDLDGDLSQGGRKYVKVLVPSAPITPTGWNYSIQLNLAAQGESTFRQYGPFSFDVIPGETVDLADVIPVSATSGTPISRGLQGEPGDLVGVTSKAASGALVLDKYPQTYLLSLTGNVTSVTLPTSILSAQSGTLTLIFTQDATGGRTVTWPSTVKWPEGIALQPAAGANTVSMINLLWTGTQWLGLLGGKSFA